MRLVKFVLAGLHAENEWPHRCSADVKIDSPETAARGFPWQRQRRAHPLVRLIELDVDEPSIVDRDAHRHGTAVRPREHRAQRQRHRLGVARHEEARTADRPPETRARAAFVFPRAQPGRDLSHPRRVAEIRSAEHQQRAPGVGDESGSRHGKVRNSDRYWCHVMSLTGHTRSQYWIICTTESAAARIVAPATKGSSRGCSLVQAKNAARNSASTPRLSMNAR